MKERIKERNRERKNDRKWSKERRQRTKGKEKKRKTISFVVYFGNIFFSPHFLLSIIILMLWLAFWLLLKSKRPTFKCVFSEMVHYNNGRKHLTQQKKQKPYLLHPFLASCHLLIFVTSTVHSLRKYSNQSSDFFTSFDPHKWK